MKKKGVSFVIPAFNEEMNIKKVIHDIKSSSDFLGLKKYEIIVVNDGSTDDTKKILDSLAKRIDILKVKNLEKNRGYAYALKEGFKEARYPLLFCTDADLQYDVKELGLLIKTMEKYGCDGVFAYRENRNDAIHRIFLSYVFNKISNKLLDLDMKDVNCSFKLFKKDVLKKIDIKSDGFLIDLEITAKITKKGFKIRQVPVKHYRRHAGKSKVKPIVIPKMIYGIFKIRKDLR